MQSFLSLIKTQYKAPVILNVTFQSLGSFWVVKEPYYSKYGPWIVYVDVNSKGVMNAESQSYPIQSEYVFSQYPQRIPMHIGVWEELVSSRGKQTTIPSQILPNVYFYKWSFIWRELCSLTFLISWVIVTENSLTHHGLEWSCSNCVGPMSVCVEVLVPEPFVLSLWQVQKQNKRLETFIASCHCHYMQVEEQLSSNSYCIL